MIFYPANRDIRIVYDIECPGWVCDRLLVSLDSYRWPCWILLWSHWYWDRLFHWVRSICLLLRCCWNQLTVFSFQYIKFLLLCAWWLYWSCAIWLFYANLWSWLLFYVQS